MCCKSEAERSAQLNATLEEIGAQIVGAKDAAEALDGEIASLTKNIEEQETRSKNFKTSEIDAKKENDDLQAQFQEHQRKNKSVVKTQAKLRRQKDSLLKQKQEMASELREAENLSRVLAEGIKVCTARIFIWREGGGAAADSLLLFL